MHLGSRFLIIFLVIAGVVRGQIGWPALASPVYELMAFRPNLRVHIKRPIAAFCIKGATFDTDRVYVCVQEENNSWLALFFRFQARTVGSPFLTSDYYELVDERSVGLNPMIGSALTSLLKDLATPVNIRSGHGGVGRRVVTVSYSIDGGIQYADKEISLYMPLLDGLCMTLSRGEDQISVEKVIEKFLRDNKERLKRDR